jgi:hypothetical protein
MTDPMGGLVGAGIAYELPARETSLAKLSYTAVQNGRV